MKHDIHPKALLRLPQIIGSDKANPPIPPLIPVCESTWWKGVKDGRYPKPIRDDGCTFWRAEDILNYIDSMGENNV